MGELSNYAFIYWNESLKRYELKIDNKVKAHTSGENDTDHLGGKALLAKMAEEKGYTVLNG